MAEFFSPEAEEVGEHSSDQEVEDCPSEGDNSFINDEETSGSEVEVIPNRPITPLPSFRNGKNTNKY